MAEDELYDRLARAHRDMSMYRSLLALMPYAVHVDHEWERAQERALRLLSRIPTQRRPVEPPRGVPARPNTQWGSRS